jgi:arylsulfatase A-like enzyme
MNLKKYIWGYNHLMNGRYKLQLQIVFMFIYILYFQAYSVSAQINPSKPNIVLFLVDDMGWQDTSVPFWKNVTQSNKLYHTPNMEKLASRGIKFTDAYATPVCTPTRVSLMSGMNAAHHRVTNWTSPIKNTNSDFPDSLFQSVDWNINGMSPIPGIDKTVYVNTLPQLLKSSGYYTIHSGKAHFASFDTPGSNPLNLGFDVNIAGSAIGSPATYLSERNYGNIAHNGKISLQAIQGLQDYYGTGTFLTDAITKEALKALEIPKQKSQPFFLHLSHYAVHIPFDADNRFLKKYLDEGLNSREAAYASLVESVDKSLGDVMNWLDNNDLTKNTVIMFLSDNGGLSRVPPRYGIAHTQNYPLKAGKGSLYEGGIRVPMIVSWPNVSKPGTVSKRYILVEDFFPTILDIAMINERQTVQQIDGKSFIKTLKKVDVKDNKRVLIWHYPNKWVPEDAPGISWFSALRKGKWKLIYNYKKQQSELYNLENDISETNNLASKRIKKTQNMHVLLMSYLKKYQAQLPIRR